MKKKYFSMGYFLGLVMIPVACLADTITSADETTWYNHYGVALQFGHQSQDRNVVTGEGTWRPEKNISDNFLVRGQLGVSIDKTTDTNIFEVLDLAVAPTYNFGQIEASAIIGYQLWLGQGDGGLELGPELTYKLNPKIWILDKIFANYERVFSKSSVDQFQLGVGFNF